MAETNKNGEWVNASKIELSQLTPELLKGCKACSKKGSLCEGENCPTKLRLQDQNKRRTGGGKRVEPKKGA